MLLNFGDELRRRCRSASSGTTPVTEVFIASARRSREGSTHVVQKRAASRRGRCRSRRYNIFMIIRGIREFMTRDWKAARENKEIYWGERIGRLGAAEGLRIAEELRLQMRRRDPGWPDRKARQADLHFHVSMTERLRRAGATRRR